jgi:hypothetical protein
MQKRVNAVVGKFTKKFGVSPDVVFYDDGLIVAFKTFKKDGKIVSMVARETEDGKIICKREVKN